MLNSRPHRPLSAVIVRKYIILQNPLVDTGVFVALKFQVNQKATIVVHNKENAWIKDGPDVLFYLRKDYFSYSDLGTSVLSKSKI